MQVERRTGIPKVRVEILLKSTLFQLSSAVSDYHEKKFLFMYCISKDDSEIMKSFKTLKSKNAKMKLDLLLLSNFRSEFSNLTCTR